MPSYAQAQQFILFGDSLTEWAFDEHNEGFGWYLEQKYQNSVQVQCEGTRDPKPYLFPCSDADNSD